MADQIKVSEAERVFAGGGEMGILMRSHDWSKTLLGSVETWPQSLKTSVRIMLTCRQPMFVWWGENLINLYNDAYQDVLCAKHPTALGKPAAELWHEIWDQVGPRAESAMLKNEGTYDEALLLIMERNGFSEETYYTFSYSPVPNDEGNAGGIICANIDDTHRVVSQRQLALLRELAAKTSDARTFDEACTLSATCFDSNPYDLPFAMIYMVDPDQQEAILAGTSGIERGQIFSPEKISLDEDCVWSFAQVIKSQRALLLSNIDTQFENLPKGAWSRSPHQAKVIPILPSRQAGKVALLVIGLNPFRLYNDNYREFIELMVAQIAASIANAQAYEEEKHRAEALAELDRAKTIFFSNISHEFRTPLTLMLSPLEDLLGNQSAITAEVRQSLVLMQRNGQRLLKLVNTLLDFSRIEAGRIEVIYEPTDLSGFTTELASVFRSVIERVNLRFTIDCPPLSQPVYIDRQMWEKIVLNFLSNAFKFTFEGEISVHLRDRKDHVELEVRDTGTGIPADELPHIFERFHRVQGARGRTYEGSGIGLSLVQELVQLHGGTIEVRSILGQGTSFIVSIPSGTAHLSKEHIGKTRTLVSSTLGTMPYIEEALRWLPPENRGGKDSLPSLGRTGQLVSHGDFAATRILLVDDNGNMRDYVRRLLSDRGYTVETATDGLMALSKIQHQAPDLVLTDVMMPQLDGFGLLQALRTQPSTRDIPVILLSARAGEESRIEGLAAGADDYLVKPFSARELLARVESNLKMAQMRQESAQREQALRLKAEAATEELENIMSRIADQFMAIDREERYIYVNDRVAQVLGKPRAEFIGQKIWELFPGVVGSQFYHEVQRAIAEQVIVNFEYFYESWQRWYEIRIYPSGNGVSIFIADISDRKQAELQLQESQRFNQQIAETLLGLIFVYDLSEQRNVYINRNVANLLGYRIQEIQDLGTNVLPTLTHPEDLESVLAYFAEFRSVPEGVMREIELRILHANGEWHWLYLRSLVFTRDPEGTPRQILGVALDISDRKQAEDELRRQEIELQFANDRFERAAMAVNCLIYDWDVEQDIIVRTKGITRILGYSLEEAEPTSGWWRNLIHSEDLPRIEAEATIQLQAGDRFSTEYRVRHKNQQYIYVQDYGIVTHDAQGNWLRVIGSTMDISDRKQVEVALREQEQFLQDLTHNVPVLLWTARPDGGVTSS